MQNTDLVPDCSSGGRRSRRLLSTMAGVIVLAWCAQCGAADDKKDAAAANPPAEAKAGATAATSFEPVPLPNPGIPGFTFPTPPEVITEWTKKNDQAAIQSHAWGIWTALTQSAGIKFDDQELRVFETWETPGDIQLDQVAGLVKRPSTRERLAPLEQLHQFQHSVELGLQATHGDATVTGFVKYDPIAAKHIRSEKLFSKATLTQMLKDGKASIPDFLPPSIALKPVFDVASKDLLVQGRYYQLAVWPGPPAPPKAYPDTSWGHCVWIDIQQSGAGSGSGKTDAVCKSDGSSRTPETTYGLANFVSFKLSAANAAALKAVSKKHKGVATGDHALLVAMHVTSREIKEWTWQTFWWAPNADAPPAPSSKEIAALRPAKLVGAPRHYAHCAAYQTLSPPQPDTGGHNVGESVYCYNPYLEAGFGPNSLPDSIPGKYKGATVANNVGVQTNCMSCHAAANFNPNKLKTAPNYSGDRYLDLNDPRFKGTLQVDFLWSIPSNVK